MDDFDTTFLENNNLFNDIYIDLDDRIIMDNDYDNDEKTVNLYYESDSNNEEKNDTEYNTDSENETMDEYKMVNDETKRVKTFHIKSEEYYEKLIVNFMKYYNEKFNKNETIFTGITEDKKTNFQMELFYGAINNFNEILNLLNIESYDLINYIYKKNEYIDNKVYKELYCLDMGDLKLYTPLLINALNYIVINEINDWVIFCLKEY
jgi:hypothetical protein